MSRAFEEVFVIADAFQGIPMAGRTDAWILADALAAHDVSPDASDLARFRDAYLDHLSTELEKPGAARKGLMPGVRELLDALAPREDVYLALLTGNYEAGARLKLEYFDLWKYFPCGAFGDDAPHRNVLVPKALATVAACGGPDFAAADAIVIGDTPLDIGCAAHVGARSLAVATGSHSVEELRAAGADDVLQDLADTTEVLRVLRIAD
jgi:phosphoglycolate phosphatase-like HAD superfamily hydrolase